MQLTSRDADDVVRLIFFLKLS